MATSKKNANASVRSTRKYPTTKTTAKGRNAVTQAQAGELTFARAEFGDAAHPVRIGNAEIAAYVLDDGRRVLSNSGLISSLDMKRGGGGPIGTRGTNRLTKFFSSARFDDLIKPELAAQLERPIIFRTDRGALAYGYDATILPELCDVVIEADQLGRLQDQQRHIAAACAALKNSLAKVGIIALVDEATGYQRFRARDELNKILSAYIAKELLPWQKRFPNELYNEMFRLHGWKLEAMITEDGRRKNPPQIVGQWTNEVVYERLAPGVLAQLKALNPKNEKGNRRHRFHQFLTEDIGHTHLRSHIIGVIALMRISDTWEEFLAHLDRAYPRQQQPAPRQLPQSA